MLRSLVVPLDGSPFGEMALPVAARIAAAHGASVHLVTVQSPASAGLPLGGTAGVAPLAFDTNVAYDPALDETRRAAVDDYLARTAARVAGDCGCRVTCGLVEGTATGETIAEEAARRGADLVVITTHGRGGFSRVWLGSVTSELLHVTTVPLLVVHATEEAEPPRTGAHGFAHVLVPVDASTHADRALEPALALGAPFGARFTLLRVVKTGESLLPYDQTFWTPAEQAAAAAQQAAAERELTAMVERLRGRGIAAEGLVVLEPDPARTILRLVAERGMDLVAMSAHTRSGAARRFLGGVTDKVIRASPVPVLVARPAE